MDARYMGQQMPQRDGRFLRQRMAQGTGQAGARVGVQVDASRLVKPPGGHGRDVLADGGRAENGLRPRLPIAQHAGHAFAVKQRQHGVARMMPAQNILDFGRHILFYSNTAAGIGRQAQRQPVRARFPFIHRTPHIIFRIRAYWGCTQ